jgi:hypothetical protein
MVTLALGIPEPSPVNEIVPLNENVVGALGVVEVDGVVVVVADDVEGADGEELPHPEHDKRRQTASSFFNEPPTFRYAEARQYSGRA